MAANPKTKKYLKTKLFKKIKADLMDQLERNGNLSSYYEDMVNDYMDLWVTKSLLRDDIQLRGVNIEYNNGGGQTGMKKNDSVEQLIKVNASMLKILADLGIKWLTSTGGKGQGGNESTGGGETDDVDL